MNPTNVVLVHYSCYPVIGGVEFIVEGQARIMAENGHRVRVLVGRGQQFTKAVEVTKLGEMGEPDPRAAKVNRELAGGRVSDEFYELKESLKTRIGERLAGADVCIIHNVMTMHFNLALTAALDELIEDMGDRVRFIVWCHDATLNDPNYEVSEPGEYPWSLLSTHNDHAAYVAISEQRRERIGRIIGVPRERIRVVPDGLDVKALLGISDHLWKMAKDFELLGDTITMLFPSRIVRRKNFELGVRIVSAMKEMGRRSRLLITGPADPHNPATVQYYEELHELKAGLDVDEEVVFLHDFRDRYLPAGKVTFDDLRDLYALSDLLLITSTQEGFGIPLLEAGAFKLPVACVNVPPLPEVVGEEALLFELDDEPRSIAERIAELIEGDNSARLFKRVLANYSWEAIYEKHLKRLLA